MTGFVESHGRRLYVHSQGEGPPVLLLHGAGSNAATWWQQLPAFSARHRCITMDLRCFGRSAAPLDECDHALFVADVCAVLDALGVDRVAVVGQSLGGMVGLRLALQHPGRVGAFVACDSPLGLDHAGILQALERRALNADAQSLEQRALGAWFLQRHPEGAALYAQINAFNPATHSLPAAEWKAAMARLMHPSQLLSFDALRGLCCPVMWLVGREDPLVPVQAMRDAQALVPGSELVVVDDCGHSTYFEKPAVFNDRVLDFLARRG
ncbi:MAG: alpha/beta hydrolase [Rubrivivax sp.]|nr:alpha/beta hydrolase [Rubrivivax sp.]